jgi:uncharacterized protein
MRRLLPIFVLLPLSAPLGAASPKDACRDYGEQLYTERPEARVVEQTYLHCRPLAEAGDAEAQYYFASSFMFRGPNQSPELVDVRKWMQRSADNGYGKAQYYMGNIHSSGPKAVEWYEKAARNGVPPASLELGRIYLQGLGVPADGNKAIYWYEFAYQKYRLRNVLEPLVTIYTNGAAGVPSNAQLAQLWRNRLETKPECPETPLSQDAQQRRAC